MKIIEVTNLVKHFGEEPHLVKAVDHVSFTAEKGEFISVVGKSGSGKTTMLHLIGGLEHATSGQIHIDGKVLSGLNDNDLTVFRRQKIGFIFQSYNLLPILNVRDNIVLPLGLDGRQADISFFKEVTGMLGIEDKLDRMPNQLSGGEQQRVAIARALITKPALILADEPTGNLDTKTSEDVLALIETTGKRFGQTVMMVTHNEKIAKKAGRMICMEDGKITKTM